MLNCKWHLVCPWGWYSWYSNNDAIHSQMTDFRRDRKVSHWVLNNTARSPHWLHQVILLVPKLKKKFFIHFVAYNNFLALSVNKSVINFLADENVYPVLGHIYSLVRSSWINMLKSLIIIFCTFPGHMYVKIIVGY